MKRRFVALSLMLAGSCTHSRHAVPEPTAFETPTLAPRAAHDAGIVEPAGAEEAPVPPSEEPPSALIEKIDDGELSERGMYRADAVGQTGAEVIPSRLFSVTLKTRDSTGAWWAFPPEHELFSGEEFIVDIELAKPAYVYVVGRSPDGWSGILFPDDELGDHERRLDAGPLRVPTPSSPKSVIRLDDCPGTEHVIVVVASTRVPFDHPIMQAIGAIPETGATKGSQSGGARSKKRSRADARAAAPPPDVRGALFMARARGGDSRARDASATIDVAAGDDGIAIYSFEVRHSPGGRPRSCAN